MKIYSDINRQNEVTDLNLGEVPAGEAKQFEFYIENDSVAYLRELKFNINHEEVKILKAPESLNVDELGKLLIEWSPSITLKEGLKVDLKIEGKEIWS